jgi:hypothetical protein
MRTPVAPKIAFPIAAIVGFRPDLADDALPGNLQDLRAFFPGWCP